VPYGLLGSGNPVIWPCRWIKGLAAPLISDFATAANNSAMIESEDAQPISQLSLTRPEPAFCSLFDNHLIRYLIKYYGMRLRDGFPDPKILAGTSPPGSEIF